MRGPERTLVVSCPDWPVVAGDPGRDARSFEAVVEAVEAFTPSVEVLRPGLCAFATRGPARYFGGDEKLAEAVAASVHDVLPPIVAQPPPVRIGVADGRFAAERAALLVHREPAVTVVARGGSAAFLAPQPVRSLSSGLPTGTGADLVDLLMRLGIRTVGEFAALPSTAVLARFGPDGESAHRLARGLDLRPLAGRTPPADLAVVAELDPPTDRVDTAAFVARGLAGQLHHDLARRGLAATRVLVEAETEHGERLTRIWRHDQGLTAAALAERVRWQLDGWLTIRDGTSLPTGALSRIRLTPDEVGPDNGRQDGFWGGDRAAAEKAGRALARVQGVLGPGAVVTAEVTGGRGLAEQVRFVPWGDGRPAARRAAGQAPPPWPGRIPAPAPGTLLPQPFAAEVLDAAGRAVMVNGRGLMSAPPARLALAGPARPRAALDVDTWGGPWPADERWWDPRSHRRRARCQLVTSDGVAYLMVLESGRWWVEAIYD